MSLLISVPPQLLQPVGIYYGGLTKLHKMKLRSHEKTGSTNSRSHTLLLGTTDCSASCLRCANTLRANIKLAHFARALQKCWRWCILPIAAAWVITVLRSTATLQRCSPPDRHCAYVRKTHHLCHCKYYCLVSRLPPGLKASGHQVCGSP